MDSLSKISSLEDKASAKVATNLCQGNGFKEVALCLEKPTYGGFISAYAPSSFVSDPELLSIWAKVKEDDRLLNVFMISAKNITNDREKVKRWDTAVDEQCQKLTEGIPLPDRLRQKIHPWINRVALEYLSYSRRQEVLFGISRYFLMDIFTREDWKEAARLDEKKLAQRLLEDERLTVLQRYRIACVYCLHAHIPQLWERLTQEEKRFIGGDGERGLSKETDDLVLLWSRYMNANQEEKVARRKNYLWTGVSQAISYGNRAALMMCWKELQEDIRQQIVIDRALQSLRQWQNMGKESYVKNNLVSNQLPRNQFADSIEGFNLPFYYRELMGFFLSQMDQEQRWTFFKKTFQSKYCSQSEYYKSVLECFLDWPHQDDFLPMVNRLWGIIPKDKYGQCLLALARKYSRNDEKENRYYDYRSLLGKLWEKTPQEYKQYVFSDRKTNYSMINEGKKLLSCLLERSPFQEKDEALFKRIFRDQPQEKRKEMMVYEWGKNSKKGETMCSLVVQKEKWSFVDWLLEECLSKEEIPTFKKQFIQSDCGIKLCLDTLQENREKLVEDLLDWSLESDTEKTQRKDALISRNAGVDVCESLLRKGKFADVERMINFCLSSDEKKERLKVLFAQRACGVLLNGYTRDSWLEDCVWEQMDTIIAWSIDTEEKRRDFKKDLFSRERIDIHYALVFIKEMWGKVECFYQWFDLSPEEIKQLKKDTLFTPQVIEDIHEDLPEYTNALVASLRWCLTDEEMVIDLKKEVEETYFTEVLDEGKKKEKERLDALMSELLDGFRKEGVQDKTSREGVFVKDKGEKRSFVVIEDEFTSPRKRRK